MHIKLRNLIAFTDQAKKLPLSRFQCCIRHHVQQADVQLANLLLQGEITRQHRLAFLA
jgi:hypothetical protein